MHPRMFISFSWVDRAAGRAKYKAGKAWVPRPGSPTSTREIGSGEVVVAVHVDDEVATVQELLRAIADDLGQTPTTRVDAS